ncbi:MAG: HEAT repeat domain-containing protein [Bryobacteraceae bacterium]
MACGVWAQAPRISDINLYGLRKVSPDKVLAAAGLVPGGRLPASKGNAEDAIEKLSGVVMARIEAVCCDGATAQVFVGIEEKGAPHPSMRSLPDGDAHLPQEIVDTYHGYLLAVAKAAARGEAAEDLTAGHPLMADPDVRKLQDRFLDFAGQHTSWLRDVLRSDASGEDRAIAATVIGYAPDKKEILNDLQFALQDPDDSVRVNAMHALAAVGVYGQKHPDRNLRVSPTWLVELLHSIVLSDRLESTKALLILTDSSDDATLGLIRDRALADLVEMARWKTLRYALPPFLLVGRVAGLQDAETERLWEKGDREAVFARAGAPTRRKP